MKTKTIFMRAKTLFGVVLISIVTLNGQSDKFTQAMLGNLEKAKTSQSMSDYQQIANSFARIAEAEKNEWTPLYYAALNNLALNFQDSVKERKEKYISLAQKQIEAGLKLKPDETEFLVLKVMSYYAEMAIDPMKGMTLMGEANSLISQAKAVNPDNPRIYLEEAEAVYHMPTEYGGGKEKAMPLLLLAKEKFDKFKSSDPLAPDWGKERCELLLEGTETSN